jgi:DNA-binding Xre family transcriptional regulator
MEASIVISYKKLWKLLIDKDMQKQNLGAAAKVSSSSLAKMRRGENVITDIVARICNALNCRVEDIMEVIPDTPITDGAADKK